MFASCLAQNLPVMQESTPVSSFVFWLVHRSLACTLPAVSSAPFLAVVGFATGFPHLRRPDGGRCLGLRS